MQALSRVRLVPQDLAAGALAQRSYNEVLTQLVTLLGDEPAVRRLTPCSSSASQRSAAHEALRSLSSQPAAHAGQHALHPAPSPGADAACERSLGASPAAPERAPTRGAPGAAAQPAGGGEASAQPVQHASGRAGGGSAGVAPAGMARQGANPGIGLGAGGDPALMDAGDREEAEALAAALALSLGDARHCGVRDGASPPVGSACGAALQPSAAPASLSAAAPAPGGGAAVETSELAVARSGLGSGPGPAAEPGGLTAQSLAAHDRRSAELPRPPPETPEAALARFEAASLARLASEEGPQALTPATPSAGGGAGDSSTRGRRYAPPSSAGATYGSQAPPSEQGLGTAYEGSVEGGAPSSPTALADGSAMSLPAAAAGSDVRASPQAEIQKGTPGPAHHGSEEHHTDPPAAGELGRLAEAAPVAAPGPSAPAMPGPHDALEAPAQLAREALGPVAPAPTAGGRDGLAAAVHGAPEAPMREQLPAQPSAGGPAGDPAPAALPGGASAAAAAAALAPEQGSGSGHTRVLRPEGAAPGPGTADSGGAERAAKVADARRIQAFLERSGSQLTEHGLMQLHRVRLPLPRV